MEQEDQRRTKERDEQEWKQRKSDGFRGACVANIVDGDEDHEAEPAAEG